MRGVLYRPISRHSHNSKKVNSEIFKSVITNRGTTTSSGYIANPLPTYGDHADSSSTTAAVVAPGDEMRGSCIHHKVIYIAKEGR